MKTYPDSCRASFLSLSLTPWSENVRDKWVDSVSPLKSLLVTTGKVSMLRSRIASDEITIEFLRYCARNENDFALRPIWSQLGL